MYRNGPPVKGGKPADPAGQRAALLDGPARQGTGDVDGAAGSGGAVRKRGGGG